MGAIIGFDWIKNYFRSKKQTKVTLHDIPLLLDKPLTWRITSGPAPNRQAFTVPREQLDTWLAFAAAHTKMDLVFDAETSAGKPGAKQTISGLYILKAEPTDHPKLGRIVVTDVREWWDAVHVMRRFNMRRNVGTKRIGDLADSELVDFAEVVPDVAYAPYSLPIGTAGNDKPWTVTGIISDLFLAKDALGSAFDFEGRSVFFGDEINSLAAASTENFVIDGPAPEALRQAFSRLPGADFYLGLDGHIYVYGVADVAGQAKQIKKLGTAIWGGGLIEDVSHAVKRPKYVRVYLTRSIEQRLDSEIRAEGSVAPANDLPGMTNVCQVVFPGGLTVAGVKRTQGEYVPIASLIAALNALAPGNKQGKLTKITTKLLGQSIMPGASMNFLLDTANLASMHDDRSKARNWAAQMSEIQSSWGRVFAINSRFWSRCLSVEDRMVSMADPETGARGRAVAFANYTIIWGRIGRGASFAKGGMIYKATPVSGYPTGKKNPNGHPSLVKGKNAPSFHVRIRDPQQGLIELVDPPSYGGDRSGILPGLGVDLPHYDPSKKHGIAGGIVWGMVPKGSEEHIPRIDPATLKAAVIATFTPAAPNTKEQLHYIDVLPSELDGYLPSEMEDDLKNCLGPPVELRIAPTVEVARIRYHDSAAHTLAHLFGTDGSDVPKPDDVALYVTNYDAIVSVAKAAAAAHYFARRDRPEGRKTGILTGEMHPAGSIETVTHSVSPAGIPTTQIDMPVDEDGLDLGAFLPESVRALVNREVKQ